MRGTRQALSAVIAPCAAMLCITDCSTTNVTNVYQASDAAVGDGGDSAAQDAVAETASGDDANDAAVVVDAGPPDLRSFFPLAVGYRWEGEFNASSCALPVYEVTGTMSGGGRAGFTVSDPCSRGPLLLASNPSHSVDLFYDPGDAGAWSVYVPAVPDMVVFGWSSVASVTVPAGTFSDCLGHGVNTNVYVVYCRGVGPVKWGFADTRGQWSLVRKSF